MHLRFTPVCDLISKLKQLFCIVLHQLYKNKRSCFSPEYLKRPIILHIFKGSFFSVLFVLLESTKSKVLFQGGFPPE